MALDGQENSTAVVDYSEIPPELRPHKPEVEPPSIAITPAKMKLSVEEMAEVEKQFGVIKLSEVSIQNLRNLGVHLERLGIDQLTQTASFVNMQAMLSVLTQTTQDALAEEKPADRLQYLKPLSHISTAASKAALTTHLVGKREDQKKKPPGKWRPLQPGEQLQAPAVAVQINNYPAGTKP